MTIAPRTVAVVGASADRRKFGNKAVRAYVRQGFRVVPINPHAAEVEGLQAYPSVLAFPDAIDRATIYVQPEVGEQVLEEIVRKGIPEVWLNPGADAPRVLERARALGIAPVVACSILDIGEHPSEY